MNALISIIIPTTAQQERFEGLKRAVESIRASSQQLVHIIALVNGNRKSEEVCRWLQEQPDVEFAYREKGSLPLAHLEARMLVETKYFGFLDDDDEYTGGALDLRLQALVNDSTLSLVVTNGYRVLVDSKRVHYQNMLNVAQDPLLSLFTENWLASCNCLFVTDKVTVNYFQNYQQYFEWTWLAFSLAMDGHRIKALNEKTFKYLDTPGSLSKSVEYDMAFEELALSMLSKEPPKQIVKMIRKKLASDYKDRALRELSSRHYKLSLHYFYKSLILYRGYKYITTLRYFVFPASIAKK